VANIETGAGHYRAAQAHVNEALELRADGRPQDAEFHFRMAEIRYAAATAAATGWLLLSGNLLDRDRRQEWVNALAGPDSDEIPFEAKPIELVDGQTGEPT
jgi:hypothetical protein